MVPGSAAIHRFDDLVPVVGHHACFGQAYADLPKFRCKMWQVGIDGAAPSDIDARGSQLVVVYPEKNLVRWRSVTDGRTLAEAALMKPNSVAAISNAIPVGGFGVPKPLV